jgi:hypothetical protein
LLFAPPEDGPVRLLDAPGHADTGEVRQFNDRSTSPSPVALLKFWCVAPADLRTPVGHDRRQPVDRSFQGHGHNTSFGFPNFKQSFLPFLLLALNVGGCARLVGLQLDLNLLQLLSRIAENKLGLFALNGCENLLLRYFQLGSLNVVGILGNLRLVVFLLEPALGPNSLDFPFGFFNFWLLVQRALQLGV